MGPRERWILGAGLFGLGSAYGRDGYLGEIVEANHGPRPVGASRVERVALGLGVVEPEPR